MEGTKGSLSSQYNQCPLTSDLLGCPVPASRLQHPGLDAVSQQEGVVVDEGDRLLLAAPTLAVALQQCHHHLQGLPGRAAPLQTQPAVPAAPRRPAVGDGTGWPGQGTHTTLSSPHQVHPQQRLVLPQGLTGPDTLIAHADTVFVGTHLGTPQPGGTAQHHRVGSLRLLDLQVGALSARGTGTERG